MKRRRALRRYAARAVDNGHELASSAAGTLNRCIVWWKLSRNAVHSSAVIFKSLCDLAIERPVYLCGPPVAQPTISVTRYLNPALETSMMSLIEQWISVQARVDHDAFDKVVDHGGDGIDASEALIERRFVRFLVHGVLLHWGLLTYHGGMRCPARALRRGARLECRGGYRSDERRCGSQVCERWLDARFSNHCAWREHSRPRPLSRMSRPTSDAQSMLINQDIQLAGPDAQ